MSKQQKDTANKHTRARKRDMEEDMDETYVTCPHCKKKTKIHSEKTLIYVDEFLEFAKQAFKENAKIVAISEDGAEREFTEWTELDKTLKTLDLSTHVIRILYDTDAEFKQAVKTLHHVKPSSYIA
jgi:hypothetical protein